MNFVEINLVKDGMDIDAMKQLCVKTFVCISEKAHNF